MDDDWYKEILENIYTSRCKLQSSYFDFLNKLPLLNANWLSSRVRSMAPQ